VTSIRANMFYEKDPWQKPLLVSLGFHALVGLGIFSLGFVLEQRGSDWGTNQGESMSVQLVAAAAVPIPHAEESANVVANESKGVTETPPSPKPVETEDGISIPGHVIKPKIEKAVPEANVRPRPMPTPEAAVPYGQGGPVSGPYGAFTAPHTNGGFSIQNSDFGSRFSWYVQKVNRTVSDRWYQVEIDPRVSNARRVYLTFDIDRSGTPSNVRVEQTSGVPSLDQSAMRALQRIDTFGPLPPEYTGSKVSVEFWFDYQR
jgi:periplasmic protein TonB